MVLEFEYLSGNTNRFMRLLILKAEEIEAIEEYHFMPPNTGVRPRAAPGTRTPEPMQMVEGCIISLNKKSYIINETVDAVRKKVTESLYGFVDKRTEHKV